MKKTDIKTQNFEFVIEPQFDDARAFDKFGFAVVEKNGVILVIRRNQKCVFSIDKTKLEVQFNACFEYDQKKYKLTHNNCIEEEEDFEPTGETIDELKLKIQNILNRKEEPLDFDETEYERILKFPVTRKGTYSAKRNGKWGVITKKGKVVIPFIFDDCILKMGKGRLKIYLNGKYGMIDYKGNIVVEPKFTNIYSFTKDGLAKVRYKGKCGYIDQTGEFVIKPRFSRASPFEHGLAVVQIDGEYGYIDRTGKFVIKPQFSEASRFARGLAAVKKDGKYGYIRLINQR